MKDMKKATAFIIAGSLLALCGCGERIGVSNSESSTISENMIYNDYTDLEIVTGEDAQKLHAGRLAVSSGDISITPVEYITALYDKGSHIKDFTRPSISKMTDIPIIECTTEETLKFDFNNEATQKIKYQFFVDDEQKTCLADTTHDGTPSSEFVMPDEPGNYYCAVILFWEDGNGQAVLSENFFKIVYSEA